MIYPKFLLEKRLICCSLCFLAIKISFALGPFRYITPLDKRIYSQNVTAKELRIDPVEFGHEMSGYDGLTIVMNLEMNLGAMQRLAYFYNSFQERYLEIFYKENTLVFRRYYPGTSDYYDYILYDQLFAEQALRKFQVSFYCTGFFFWIQVGVEGGNYLSPVYFGLNAPGRTNMQEIIDANARIRIVLGDSNNPDPGFVIRGVTAYAFHYDELRQDIYTHFSRL